MPLELTTKNRRALDKDDVRAFLLGKQDPWLFFRQYVQTQERNRGIQPYPDFPYLQTFIQALFVHRLVVILKSRQMMASWTVCGFLLWDCIFNGYSDNLIISKREDEANELLYRVRIIYKNLPDCMQLQIGYNNKNVLEFPHRHSRIISLPASPDIGRTYAPRRIFWDEMAFTPNDEEVFTSLQPALDGGGKFIGVSTANGLRTKHAQLCLHAEEQGYFRLDLHYRMSPVKNEEWKHEAMKGMSKERWDQEQEMKLEYSGNRVYERFSEDTHVIDWDYQRLLPVYRAVDFGYHTPVVLWMQVTEQDEVIVIREWIGQKSQLSEMLVAIQMGDSALGISEKDVRMTFCDPAGSAKKDEGVSSVNYLQDRGVKLTFRSSSVGVGVELVREKLMDAAGRVALKVDRSCEKIIEDFRGYRRHSHSDEPVKDGLHDHTMDALRYFIVNYFSTDTKNYPVPVRLQGVKR